MATKVVCTLKEEKQGLQKQLGCMNGLFQLFDRRYLLGLHRYSRSHNRLTSGPSENGEKEFKNSSEKVKEKNPKKVMVEKNRGSVESSRNSFSSSCSSTTFSSFECSKRVQTEWQLPSEVTTPNLNKRQPGRSVQTPDIRDVVRDSMTREVRVTKDNRVGPIMKHVDSPRPFIPQKSVQYDRKDQNHIKVQKPSLGVKETSRLSCDERESQYSLKSTFKVKELPRLSLDSKQNYNRNSINESRSEPGSNKRPSSGVVARLMGLESLPDSSCEVETVKAKPPSDDQLVLSSKWSREGEECKQNHKSVYGEMEKRLSALEFKTSGKDLRALKQILEGMQIKNMELEKHQPCSPTVRISSPKRRELVNRTMKPAKMATESMTITGGNDANRTTTKQVKDPTFRNKKGPVGRTPRSLSPSNSSKYVTGERPVSSPKLQSSKNGVHKQCFQRPSSDSSRIKKQSNVKAVVLDLKTRHATIKPLTPLQNNEQSCRYRNDGDIGSPNKLEVTRNYQPKENLRVSENYFAERLMKEKPMVELAKLTVEQPSPVSVLDAFYVEDTPSPVKKKSSAFNDYEDLHDDEIGWNQVGVYNLMNNTNADQYSEFNNVKVEDTTRLIRQIELLKSSNDEAFINETEAFPCKSTNADHEYISEILLASGFLKDLDSAIRIVQLHPTTSLIKLELFHLLNAECHKKNPISKSNDEIRRKMIFDSLNEILFRKLVVSGSSGLWTGKRCGKFLNGEKLLKELCSEIDYLQNCSERCLFDEDDEVKNLVSADVNNNSEDWDKCCYEVPGVVLDIERLIFKDLIDEVVNAEVASLQDRPRRHCRRLFSM